ncbi:hypothetical protein PQX77_002809 [Marasmius sp. AFHP31]|nr:hypothetical protein PQX77_002809 [Marasmius sp. AFHP31]
MAVINIGAILEYNKSNSILKRCGSVSSQEAGSVNPKDAKDNDKMDVDEEKGSVFSPPSDGKPDSIVKSMGFKLALEPTFTMLSYILQHPFRRASTYSKSRLNPYLTVILTLLATMLKHERAWKSMERSIP